MLCCALLGATVNLLSITTPDACSAIPASNSGLLHQVVRSNASALELALIGGMHLREPTKPALPDTWLADLLAKALLLEYQQPTRPTNPKGKRSGKKAHLHGKRSRASRKSTGNELPASLQFSANPSGSKDAALVSIPGRIDGNCQKAVEPSSWHLEAVPVFHLFAQVRRLLGR